MDTGGDFSLLTDEKFDFDISLSPSSAKEDCDDEVFIGPVKHKEKCVRAAIASDVSEEKTPPQCDQVAWSPLSADKFVEIFKEAHLLALQLGCLTTDDEKKEQPAERATNQVVEKFVQESKSKLKILETGLESAKTPVVIKRETYCVTESPFHQLPPSVQQRLNMPSTEGGKQVGLKMSKQDSPAKVQKSAKTLSVSPLAQKTKALPWKNNVPAASTSKPTLSRLQPMKTSTTYAQKNLLTVEKPKTSKKPSPVRRKHLSSAGSSEDLISDKSSIASDVSDTSFNNSTVGQTKKTLPASSKLSLKNTQFKAPTSTAYRRNTSSSSSSHSSINTSLNSSLSFSPPASNAKINASLNISASNSKIKSNPSRLALVRPTGGSTSSIKANGTELPSNLLKPGGAVKGKIAGNNSKSSSVQVVQPQTPSGKFQRQISAPNLQRLPVQTNPESAVKGASCTKPQARVLPTPTSRLKLPQRPTGMSPDRPVGRKMQPTRLMSCGDIGSGIEQSTPMREIQAVPSNIPLVGRSVSSATPSTKRASALPTPVNRRTSGMLTPRTLPRSLSSLRQTPALPVSNKSAIKCPVNGPVESDENGLPAVTSPCSPTDEDTPEIVPCSLNFSPESKPACLEQSDVQKCVAFPVSAEALLIDIGMENHEKDVKVKKMSADFDSQPLIDLSNTPELNKRIVSAKAAHVGQLIDFSSPLIKLSPIVNKENMDFDSPLLKF
ncbi:G2 and S phase-expressed protein 1 [Spea bombifrons]|uniref:G2 and S phase-expressed protein 1 n=1 Tax=Spea bombifrons TaxID=233779 RepID=UPI00234ADD73|nr:G2 and S phase-expressed protein 1 [Spea bombifrons]